MCRPARGSYFFNSLHMKHWLFVPLLFCSLAVFAQPRAIGARLGDGVGFSYQHTVERGNVIDLDVDFPAFYNGAEVVFTYDWVFPLTSWQYKGSWNFLAGVGFGAGVNWLHHGYYIGLSEVGDRAYDTHTGYGSPSEFSGTLGVAGRFCFEYNFEIPLQLSVDWRPYIGPAVGEKESGQPWSAFNYGGLFEGSLCLGIRYRFD